MSMIQIKIKSTASLSLSEGTEFKASYQGPILQEASSNLEHILPYNWHVFGQVHVIVFVPRSGSDGV
jgi:hypothetical protein